MSALTPFSRLSGTMNGVVAGEAEHGSSLAAMVHVTIQLVPNFKAVVAARRVQGRTNSLTQYA